MSIYNLNIVTNYLKEEKEKLLSEDLRKNITNLCYNKLVEELYNNYFEKKRLEEEIKKMNSEIMGKLKNDKFKFYLRTSIFEKPINFFSFSFSSGERIIEINEDLEYLYGYIKILFTLNNSEKDSFIPLSKELKPRRSEIKSHSTYFIKNKEEIFKQIKEIIIINIKKFSDIKRNIDVVSKKIFDLLLENEKDYNYDILFDFFPKNNKSNYLIFNEGNGQEEFNMTHNDYTLNIIIYSFNKLKNDF